MGKPTFANVITALEKHSPTSFATVVTEFEKRKVSDSIWTCGVFKPGVFDCGEFCKLRKRLEVH